VALCWKPGGLESSARMVKVNVPEASGVPVSSPAGDRVRPGGSDPESTLYAYGAVPPVATRKTW
jgi:hypothetical protein